MKIIPFAIMLLCLITIISCKKYDKNGNEIKTYNELAKAKWLIGEWEKTDSIGTLREIWKNEEIKAITIIYCSFLKHFQFFYRELTT